MELVLSMFGADQPGLVSGLTEILYDREANLGDADMTRIGGTFAFILTFSLPDENVDGVKEDLKNFSEEKDLLISTAPDDDFESEWGSVDPDTLVSVYGSDRPGIVYRVSEELAARDVNICDLHSSRNDEEDLYIMTLEVHTPDRVDREDLRGQLRDLGTELDVEITVKALTEPPL